MTLEALFRSVFLIAVIIFWLMGVGFFLLGIKLALLFTPQIQVFGMIITY